MQPFVRQNRPNENSSNFGKPLQTLVKIQQTVQKPGKRLREKGKIYSYFEIKFTHLANMQRETEILFSSFIKSRKIFQYLFTFLIGDILLYNLYYEK